MPLPASLPVIWILGRVESTTVLATTAQASGGTWWVELMNMLVMYIILRAVLSPPGHGPQTWDDLSKTFQVQASALSRSTDWHPQDVSKEPVKLLLGHSREGWVGAFHHPAKTMRPLTHNLAKMGALAKPCCTLPTQ